MPSAGALCQPQIIPLRKPMQGLPSNHIDTTTYIEISSESPNCNFFFTTDGTKPSPFQRRVAGREITFKYLAPFTMKPGKRTLKVIAVSKDGVRESDTITRSFQVDNIGTMVSTSGNWTTDTEDGTSVISFATEADRHRISNKNRINKKMHGSPLRKSLNTSPVREAWGTGTTQLSQSSEAPLYDNTGIPDGPFNPTNYAGTQINVWGGSPGNGMNVSPAGAVTFGNGCAPGNQNSTQYGFITEQMIQNCKPPNKCLTVGDLRKVLDETQPKDPPPASLPPPPPPPAIEYPVYKDPPLNTVSPGNGDWKEQILHIYAHMLDYAKSNTDFKIRVSEPKIGKMLSAEFVDEGDGYRVSLVMAKPGVPRGAIKRKPLKVETAVKAFTAQSQAARRPSKDKEVPKPKPKPKPKSDPYFEMETENLHHEGTVKAYDKFNAEIDAQVLQRSMKGLGTDEETIINVMGYRSNPQRQEIASTYKTLFGKDLIAEFKSELSGNVLDTLKGLCLKPAEFDAKELRNAIKGLGTDDEVLIEILCTRSSAQIKEVINTYKQTFNRDLEKDIISDTSGNFKRLLVSLVQASRSDSNEVDRNKARQDARALLEAGEKKWGTDEAKFNTILISRSYPQLRATFEEYGKISKKDIEDALKSELSGDLLRGMLTIVRCVRNKTGHFARQLMKTMKGGGTDDDSLLRIIISRCETDLVQIKEEFQELTEQTLEQFISNDISGNYREIILSLVGGGAPPDMASKSGKGFVEAVRAKTDEQLDEEVRMETETIKADPTLMPYENFNAETDAEALKKAMKGLGTDEAAIINVLGYRAIAQRLEIYNAFKNMFGKDLIKELKSELSGNFKNICTGLCLSAADFDATMIKNAVKGLGTDEKVLVEMICTRSNQQINDFKQSYTKLFSKNVEDDVASDTSGHFKRLLIGLLQSNRDESTTFDRSKAHQDAQALYDAGEKKLGTDESRFNSILVSRSYAQLRAMFQEYAKISNNDIEDVLKKEMSGDILQGMLAIVRCIRNKSAHFSTELKKAMKGLGTDDDTVVRIIVSRCEVDMVQIKEEFQKMFKQSLGMFINDDTSGDYRTMLLGLIRDDDVLKKKTKKKGGLFS